MKPSIVQAKGDAVYFAQNTAHDTLGVEAVAWTTVISEALEAALTLVFLFDKHYGFVRMSLRHYSLDLKGLWEVLRNGVPAGVETLIFSISNVVIQAAANQYLSASAVAGNTASDNLEGYIFCVLEAFAVAVSSVAAQNLGANKKENLRKTLLYSFSIIAVLGFLLGGIAAIWRGPLIDILIKNTSTGNFVYSEAYETGTSRLLMRFVNTPHRFKRWLIARLVGKDSQPYCMICMC